MRTPITSCEVIFRIIIQIIYNISYYCTHPVYLFQHFQRCAYGFRNFENYRLRFKVLCS
ncbi:TPA: hypothetical protein GJ770_11210 [Legionella pneumophila]|nr:hypothetical protein [Legionella pneumophila]